jgi:uncharacterized membrane protein YeaQ/YmgE (transglycosylase-associated protein family)
MLGLLILVAVAIVAFIAIKAVSGVVGFLIMVGVWMLIGYLAGQLIRGKDYGLLGNVLLGLAGGIVGSIVLRLVGVNFGDIWIISNVIVGVIGAAILIYAVRLFSDKDFAK